MPRGRPPFVPGDKDRATVKAMAGFGIPEVEIATILTIDPKTLRKHFAQELATGHVEANAKVAASLYRRATGEGREAVIAAIFWLKCRAGWREHAPGTEPPPGKKGLRAAAALASAVGKYAPPPPPRGQPDVQVDWGDDLDPLPQQRR